MDPSEPPAAPPTPPHLSSPVKMAPFYAEHIRHEVEAFAYEGDVHQPEPFKTERAFLEFLQVEIPSKLPKPKFTLSSFLTAANAMSQFIQEECFPESDLLVWKDTGTKAPPGHVTDAKCKPDITVAIKEDFKNGDIPLWPCIRLAGEQASGGKNRKEHRRQAISYLHYLLLARPDLHVGQGMLTSKKTVMFLLGIGSVGIRSLRVEWTNKSLNKLMYAFIHRLYKPGDFVDPSYKMVHDRMKNSVTYTVRIATSKMKDGCKLQQHVDCPGLLPVYASNPFGTRTHVLSNPLSTAEVDGRVLTVLKDQFCRHETRFKEEEILKTIHDPETVPGVVEMVHHETMDLSLPHLEQLGKKPRRRRNRIGMRQVGDPFTSIPTLQEMLETVYDLLEVLRFLRVKRQVLHRDISKGNVMFIDPRKTAPTDVAEAPVKKAPIKFVKFILDESPDPHETSLLLVDFNHAEDLAKNQGHNEERTTRTGTPVFIARAVEMCEPYPFPEGSVVSLPKTPSIPECYASAHPDRKEKFPMEGVQALFEPSKDSSSRRWRHELDHDSESVFWLLLCWCMGAQPDGSPAETLGAGAWATMLRTPEERHHGLILLLADMRAGSTSDIVHSVYRPVLPLLSQLAKILCFDRHWLDDKDTRNDPEYIAEAFQRLILQFLIDQKNEPFMTWQVTGKMLRQVQQIPRIQSLSYTSNQKTNSENAKKRSFTDSQGDQPEVKEREPKRNRRGPTANEVGLGDDLDEDEEDDEEEDDVVENDVDEDEVLDDGEVIDEE